MFILELARAPLISIHALREEGDSKRSLIGSPIWISIHALREEGDGEELRKTTATLWISIHALREEGDSKNREKIPAFGLV